MTNDYKHNDTHPLFIALNVLDGQVIGQCQLQHTHLEWLKFLKQINRETPKYKALHLIADNYATHTSHQHQLAIHSPGIPQPIVEKIVGSFLGRQPAGAGFKKSGGAAREKLGRKASSTFLIVDAQNVKNTDTAGLKGYDAGKKVSRVSKDILQSILKAFPTL